MSMEEILKAYEDMKALEPILTRIECHRDTLPLFGPPKVLERYSEAFDDKMAVTRLAGIPIYLDDSLIPGEMLLKFNDGTITSLYVRMR